MAQQGGSGWRSKWSLRRNRILADPRFQSWAARFPLTRPIARRRAAGLFDLVSGFVQSQTLYAFVRLDLLTLLADGPTSIEAVASATDLPRAGAERLLRAAAAIGLAERIGDHFLLGQMGAALAGNPGIVAMVAHHPLLYADLADPVALLRHRGGGALAAYWPYAQGDIGAASDRVAAYSALMAASQPMVAAQILGSHDFSRHRHLMDVGGGEGAFLLAVAERYPDLKLTLFDLPAVTARARARCGERIFTVSGSFRDSALPQGADLISLVRILHDHDDAVVAALLGNIFAALPPGGTLLVAEPLAETPYAESVEAYFQFYLLAMGSGRPRSARELKSMLQSAGFADVQQISTPLPLAASLIVARRP